MATEFNKTLRLAAAPFNHLT